MADISTVLIPEFAVSTCTLSSYLSSKQLYGSLIPNILSFSAIPASLPYGGGTVNLSWATTDATSLSISGVGTVTHLTNIDVSPSVTTMYTLSAVGDITAKESIIVTVDPPPPPVLTILSVVAGVNTVSVQFSDSLQGVFSSASAPSNWIVTNTDTGSQLAVNAITVCGDTITLSTEEQKIGDNYSVVVPNIIVDDANTLLFNGPETRTFVGAGNAPAILNIRTIDARTIMAYFTEEVVEAEALNVSNYSVDNGLSILSVTKLGPTIYRLATSRQTTGIVYTITATNIHDLAGNLIGGLPPT